MAFLNIFCVYYSKYLYLKSISHWVSLHSLWFFYHISFYKALSFNAVFLTSAIYFLTQEDTSSHSWDEYVALLSSWLVFLFLSLLCKGKNEAWTWYLNSISYCEIVFNIAGLFLIFHTLSAGSESPLLKGWSSVVIFSKHFHWITPLSGFQRAICTLTFQSSQSPVITLSVAQCYHRHHCLNSIICAFLPGFSPDGFYFQFPSSC